MVSALVECSVPQGQRDIRQPGGKGARLSCRGEAGAVAERAWVGEAGTECCWSRDPDTAFQAGLRLRPAGPAVAVGPGAPSP